MNSHPTGDRPAVSYGFRIDPLSQINDIRNLLRDRYHTGFPVLKELIQNADDAGASVLHIGWCAGLSEPHHPLLHGPALFVCNNRGLTSANVEALRYLSLGSKAGDENVIGKFGLGLKSVFHLTEVYFYLSDDMGKRGFLNPWSPARHSEWDSNVEEAIDRLVTTLPPFLRGEEGWFCLYLPLRSGLWGEPFIVEEFPGSNGHSPTDLLDLQALRRIAGFFPLLKHLSSIRFMRTGIDFKEPAEIGSVSLGDSSERHEGFLQLGDSPRPLHGSVRLGGGDVGPVGFSGFESLAAVAKASALQLRPNWPRSISIDPHTTKPIEVKIKATSHVAVYFTSRPCQGQGSFATRWSVFLPLEEDGQPQTLKTEREISLYLHGYFFVDSGRRRIEWPLAPLANQDERQVRLAWNALLRDEGILPLVLPALDQFVREESLTYKRRSENRPVNAA